jgi:putative PIN family toxin of toxin-antitoxin system
LIRAVIDTNIVISGLLFGGLPYKAVKAAIERKFMPVLSAALIEEIDRVMRSKKFGLSDQEARILTSPFFEKAEIVVPTSKVNAIPRCPGDNRVLECAIDGKCKYIVTGDRRDLQNSKTSWRFITQRI